jgi:hypothetical protein
VSFDNGTNDRQSKTRSPYLTIPGLVQSHEALEDSLTVNARDARSVVRDDDQHIFVVTHRLDADGSMRVPDRVVDEVP